MDPWSRCCREPAVYTAALGRASETPRCGAVAQGVRRYYIGCAAALYLAVKLNRPSGDASCILLPVSCAAALPYYSHCILYYRLPYHVTRTVFYTGSALHDAIRTNDLAKVRGTNMQLTQRPLTCPAAALSFLWAAALSLWAAALNLWATAQGCRQVRHLIEVLGHQPNIPDAHGHTPLWIACAEGHMRCLLCSHC